MKLATIVEGVQDLATRLNELRPAMAAAAQAIYDAWDPEYDEFGDAEVGGGGICDQIAQAIGEILTDASIDYTDGGHEGDDHAYLIAYDDQNSYLVDIPYSHYESGGGMSWTRHPDVIFTPEMIEIHETHRPDWINESYEGLEDADKFEENQTDFCDGCTHDFHWDDLDTCNSCDSVWCDYCVSKGSSFDWVPENTENGREHPDAGMMIACPRCMPDDYVSPYPADQYGEGTLENSGESPWHPRPAIPPGYVKESYEGLEDEDQFRQADFCWCGSEILPNEDVELCHGCNVAMCHDCVDQGLIHGRAVFCPDCAKTVTESYEGLEDEDSFKFKDDHCMHCGREFNLRNRVVGYGCHVHGCECYTCQDCMTPNGWDYDWSSDYGSVATCPHCVAAYDIE